LYVYSRTGELDTDILVWYIVINVLTESCDSHDAYN